MNLSDYATGAGGIENFPLPQGGMKAEETDLVRMQQEKINEGIFSMLNTQHEEAVRDVNFLEQALRAACSRERVLGAAMSVLNEPQQAVVPPFR